ncbi:MAG: hypothetical protein ABH879_06070 [archaeon]
MQLDVALVDRMGCDIRTKEAAICRLGDAYELRYSTAYHALMLWSAAGLDTAADPPALVRRLHAGVETFGADGTYVSARPIGWPEARPEFGGVDRSMYWSPPISLSEGYAEKVIAGVRETVRLYADQDNGQKMVAVVGSDCLTIPDPRSLSHDARPDGPSAALHGFLQHGESRVLPGAALLEPDVPDLALEACDELPGRLAAEALEVLVAACAGIFEPRLVYTEFGANVTPKGPIVMDVIVHDVLPEGETGDPVTYAIRYATLENRGGMTSHSGTKGLPAEGSTVPARFVNGRLESFL